ncbi:MAG: hypothetical protein EBY17_22660 [Acidobacteriia bacterium]|nr:hypothetical protein [Terriglobia bacterium]
MVPVPVERAEIHLEDGILKIVPDLDVQGAFCLESSQRIRVIEHAAQVRLDRRSVDQDDNAVVVCRGLEDRDIVGENRPRDEIPVRDDDAITLDIFESDTV